MNEALLRLATSAAGRPLLLRASQAAIRRQLAKECFTSSPPPDGKRVRVGVVQLEGQLFKRAADFAAHMYHLTRRAVEDGAQLVVFPEDTGSYPLGGLIPGLERLVGGGGGAEGGTAVQSGEAPVLTLFRVLEPAARRIFEATFSTLARSFQVHILAGSTLAIDRRGAVYKEAQLYGRGGELILRQRKTHLIHTEALWGLTPADEIQVARTALGAIASPICMDHTYWEPIRIAWLQGAEIIIDPAADPSRYNRYAQARGVWGRVQESPCYGIHCLMVGNILGNEFGGRSGVYAPLALTVQRDGILAQAQSGDREEVLGCTLNLEALRDYRQEQAPDVNLALYRRYLPTAYALAHGARVNGRRVIA